MTDNAAAAKAVRAQTRTKQMAQCAMFTALLAVCSQIAIPLPLVPINLALFAVYLAAFLLDRRYALLSVGLYLMLGEVGLPVFAGKLRRCVLAIRCRIDCHSRENCVESHSATA